MTTEQAQDIPALLKQAERLLAGRSFEPAQALCLEVLKREPSNAEAFFLLGILAAEHSQFTKSLELFTRAIDAEPANPKYYAHRARSLVVAGKPAEARADVVKAAALEPVDAPTLSTIGSVHSRTGAHAEAAAFFRRAVERQGDVAGYVYNLAAALQFIGEFEEAEAAYRRAIELEPGNYRCYSAVVQLSKQTPERNFIEPMQRLFDRAVNDADQRLHLGHALAKTYEDIGDYQAAYKWLQKAKELKRKALNYSIDVDFEVFKMAPRTLKTPTSVGFSSSEPIFVVGMPRSGTTLTDRILSSHPQVASAGESVNFGLLIKRMTKTKSNLVIDAETLEKAMTIDLAKLGADYVEATRPKGTVTHFVDKMPLNFFYAALITKALPNARIICLRRDPMDTCLSNYRQLFATNFPFYGFTLDISDTGRYYAMFDALIALWRKTLPPDRFTELSYDALVADQEGETRRLLDFCGLPWDERCLAFELNEAPVATASSVQVRQPLYSSSVGRWKLYGDALQPLERTLAESVGKIDLLKD